MLSGSWLQEPWKPHYAGCPRAADPRSPGVPSPSAVLIGLHRSCKYLEAQNPQLQILGSPEFPASGQSVWQGCPRVMDPESMSCLLANRETRQVSIRTLPILQYKFVKPEIFPWHIVGQLISIFWWNRVPDWLYHTYIVHAYLPLLYLTMASYTSLC